MEIPEGREKYQKNEDAQCDKHHLVLTMFSMHTSLQVHFDCDVLLQMFACDPCQPLSTLQCLHTWFPCDGAAFGHLLSPAQKAAPHSPDGKGTALRHKSGTAQRQLVRALSKTASSDLLQIKAALMGAGCCLYLRNTFDSAVIIGTDTSA